MWLLVFTSLIVFLSTSYYVVLSEINNVLGEM